MTSAGASTNVRRGPSATRHRPSPAGTYGGPNGASSTAYVPGSIRGGHGTPAGMAFGVAASPGSAASTTGTLNRAPHRRHSKTTTRPRVTGHRRQTQAIYPRQQLARPDRTTYTDLVEAHACDSGLRAHSVEGGPPDFAPTGRQASGLRLSGNGAARCGQISDLANDGASRSEQGHSVAHIGLGAQVRRDEEVAGGHLECGVAVRGGDAHRVGWVGAYRSEYEGAATAQRDRPRALLLSRPTGTCSPQRDSAGQERECSPWLRWPARTERRLR